MCKPRQGFPGDSLVKHPPAKAGDMGLVPALGRSSGEGNGTTSSILAWKVPWAEDPGGLESMVSEKTQAQFSYSTPNNKETKMHKAKIRRNMREKKIKTSSLVELWH